MIGSQPTGGDAGGDIKYCFVGGGSSRLADWDTLEISGICKE